MGQQTCRAEAEDDTRALLWRLLLLSTLAFAVGIWATGLRLDISQSSAAGITVLVGGCIVVLCRDKPQPELRKLMLLFESLSLFTAISLVGAISTYVAAAFSSGWSDAAFARADAAIGFDWPAWYRWTISSPALNWAGGVVYRSIWLVPLIILITLNLGGHHARSQQFLLAFWLALVITVASFPFFPAMGPFTYYGFEQLGHAIPGGGVAHIGIIEGARDSTLGAVPLHRLAGIIAMPSFHAASALLFAWAVWPSPTLRWPIAILEAAMLLSTPVIGNHYLVDIFAGLGVALVAIWASGLDRTRWIARGTIANGDLNHAAAA